MMNKLAENTRKAKNEDIFSIDYDKYAFLMNASQQAA